MPAPRLVRTSPAPGAGRRWLWPLALGLLSAGCAGNAAPAEEEKPPAAPVKVEPAEIAVLGEWTELLGATEPLPGHVAHVSAAAGGRVLSVLDGGKGKSLAEGQEVKRGRVLLRLDDRIARAARDRAQAALDELTEQAKQAEYAAELARIDLDRVKSLNPGGTAQGSMPLISRIELDKARINLQDAESKQRLVLAKGATARAELKGLQEQLDLYTVHSPIAGRLGMVRVAPGQTLAVGAPVADVVDLKQIDVLCFAPPHLVGKLALDQPARLAGEKERPGASAAGKVCFIAVQAEPDSGNFAVKVRFPNPGLALRAGNVQRVQVLTQAEKKRTVIPEAALLEDQDPPLVVVAEDVKTEDHEGKKEKVGKARRLQAGIGARERGKVVELLRLTDPETHKEVPVAGALFVVEGSHGLETGDPVRIEEAEHDEHEGHEGKEP